MEIIRSDMPPPEPQPLAWCAIAWMPTLLRTETTLPASAPRVSSPRQGVQVGAGRASCVRLRPSSGSRRVLKLLYFLWTGYHHQTRARAISRSSSLFRVGLLQIWSRWCPLGLAHDSKRESLLSDCRRAVGPRSLLVLR